MNVSRDFPSVSHDLEKKLSKLKTAFEQETSENDFAALEERISDLREIVNCPRCHQSYTRAWSDSRENLLRDVQSLAAKSFGLIEKAASYRLSKDHRCINDYLKEVSRTTIRHGEVASFDHRSRVLFIGCGAMPLSCHILVRHFGCRVVGIDADLDAIEQSKELTKNSYQDRLSLEYGLGEQYPAKGFSHVMVASLVPEKEAILTHLHRSVDPGSKIVCRFGNGLQRLLNYPLKTGPRKEWERLWMLGDLASLYQTLVFSKR